MAYNLYPAVDENYNFPPEVRAAIAAYAELLSAFAAKSLETTVGAHIGDGANPHHVTKEQIGLGNVDNTSDILKPISTAVQTALDAKAPLNSPNFIGTVTGITKAMVGLGNVDNTSDANKPVPQSVFDAINKVAKGLVAASEMTTASAQATGQQIIMNIPSFTFLANRQYEIEWTTSIVNTTGASNAPLAQLYTCPVADAKASTSNLTEIMGYNCSHNAAGQTVRASIKRKKLSFNVDTTLQIKASLNGMGSQNMYTAAGATWPSQLTITDNGLQL